MNFILLYKLVNQVLVSSGKWKTGLKKNKQDLANLCEAHFFFYLREIKVSTVDWYEGHQSKCCNLKVTLTTDMSGGGSLGLTQDSPFFEDSHPSRSKCEHVEIL